MIPAGLGRVLVPAVMTFAAGLLLGWVWGRHSLRPAPPGLEPDLAAYHAALVGVLELDADQAADLGVLLRYYEVERRRLLQAQRVALEPGLAELDQRFELLIRNRILSPGQRDRAAQLLQATPVGSVALSAPEDRR